MKRRAQLVLALDVDDFRKARHYLDLLYPKIKIFKVGIQLFSACGPQIIKAINDKGAEVFLDLKFLDIPNTVANAVRQAVRMKVKMFTLHISGGAEMLGAALKAAEDEAAKAKAERPLLIGVTVLTSKDAAPADVLVLAEAGLKQGADGVVCSAREAEFLRRQLKREFVIVTPGIRPQGIGANDDQRRAVTAAEAVKAGSDFLVVGRPILEAADPVAAADKILEESAA